MKKITRKLAGYVCSTMLITCIVFLRLAIKKSTTWLIVTTTIGILIYGIGILLVILDKLVEKYG